MDILQQYHDKIEFVRKWIFDLLSQHNDEKIPITELKFKNLQNYFNENRLKKSYVIYCDKIPVMPLKEMGLGSFSEMETRHFVGMTYLDCFFIREDKKNNESLHFHELIHIIQWDYLGLEKFLFCYALGLTEKGYRDSQLEEMAYNHQAKFDNGIIYNVEDSINEEMKYFDALLAKFNIFPR